MKPNLSIAILVFSLLACLGQNPTAGEKPATSEQTAEVRRIIVTWLECEECTAGELEAVVKLGTVAVPALAEVLHGGPSQASRELLRRHLITTYRELKKYETTHPEAKVAMSEEEYVKTYSDSHIALYQVRAAMALGAIGGPDAKRALGEALETPP